MRSAFLALLSAPAHGYELKQALEQRFGSALSPLNAGRCTRPSSGSSATGSSAAATSPGDTRQKRVYELTEAGREALMRWVTAPTPATRLRDEFFLKLVLAGHPASPIRVR